MAFENTYTFAPGYECSLVIRLLFHKQNPPRSEMSLAPLKFCKCSRNLLLVSPTRREKRLHQRGSAQPSKDYNSSQITFKRNIRNFHNRLLERGYSAVISSQKYLSEVKFGDRKIALQEGNKSASIKLLPFVTQYHPALPSLERILMGKWHLIQTQHRLREIFKEPPLISSRKGKSLKDLLVRAKFWRLYCF